MPTAAKKQNVERPGRAEEVPRMKAKKSVREVMVMETPAEACERAGERRERREMRRDEGR